VGEFVVEGELLGGQGEGEGAFLAGVEGGSEEGEKGAWLLDWSVTP